MGIQQMMIVKPGAIAPWRINTVGVSGVAIPLVGYSDGSFGSLVNANTTDGRFVEGVYWSAAGEELRLIVSGFSFDPTVNWLSGIGVDGSPAGGKYWSDIAANILNYTYDSLNGRATWVWYCATADVPFINGAGTFLLAIA